MLVYFNMTLVQKHWLHFRGILNLDVQTGSGLLFRNTDLYPSFLDIRIRYQPLSKYVSDSDRTLRNNELALNECIISQFRLKCIQNM